MIVSRAQLLPVMMAAALVAAPSRSDAQLRATLDAGGANVRYADSVSVMARTLSPSVTWGGDVVRASAMGVLSSLTDDSHSMQGAVALSLLSPSVGIARVEIGADAGGTTHQDGTRTGRYLGRARFHSGLATRGAWLSGAAGHTWDGARWHTVAEGELGAWVRSGRFSLLGVATPSAVGDSIRYTDGQAIIRWDAARTELQAGAGFRMGDALVRESPGSWGSVTATVWLFPQLGLVGSAGSYPMDFTQGFPGGRYVSAALRIAAQPRRASDRLASAAVSERRSARNESSFTISTASDGRRLLRLHAPAARRVEIMGDLTNWTPVVLTPASGGWWTVTLPVAAGIYQVNVRIDGRSWTVPPGLPSSVDEFGVRVGVLQVR